MDRRMVLGLPLVGAVLAAMAHAQEHVALPPLAAPTKTRLVFPTDDTFWFKITNVLGNAEYGGPLLGEVLSAVSHIKEGDFESWYAAFNTMADRVAIEGESQLARGHKVSARDSLLRASYYYFTSEFFLHGNPKDPRIQRSYGLCVKYYQRAAALFDTPILPVEIPYDGKTLPGYWHRPVGDGQPRPTLILHTGFDGSAEGMHFGGARAAVERGYNALSFDGPGQYGPLHRDGLVFRPDWERVITPVVDYLSTRPDVDQNRIVYMGVSLGGVLAPRAAAFEHRIAAMVANDGMWDFGEVFLEAYPANRRAEIIEKIKAPSAPDLDQQLDAVLHGGSSGRWVFQHGMWAMGATSPRDFVRKALDFNVSNGVAEKIRCPTLVCLPEGDALSVSQAPVLYSHLTCKKSIMRFTVEEGAGAHCQIGAGRLAFARIFDWLDETLHS